MKLLASGVCFDFSDWSTENTRWWHTDSVLGTYKHATGIGIIVICWLSKAELKVEARIHPHQSGRATPWKNSLCPQLVITHLTFHATKLWNWNTWSQKLIWVYAFRASPHYSVLYNWGGGNTHNYDVILQTAQCNCCYILKRWQLLKVAFLTL